MTARERAALPDRTIGQHVTPNGQVCRWSRARVGPLILACPDGCAGGSFSIIVLDDRPIRVTDMADAVADVLADQSTQLADTVGGTDIAIFGTNDVREVVISVDGGRQEFKITM